MELEAGTIEALCDNQTDHPLCVAPILQIISFSLPEQGQAMNKIKANLSDGKFYVKTAISSNYIEHFKNGILKNFSLVKLKKFGIKSKDDLPILIIVSIDVFQNFDKKIGTPVSIAYRHKLVEEYNTDQLSISNSKESFNTMKKSPPQKTLEKNFEKDFENKKVKTDENENYAKIIALNPFLSNWTIKGTVITKSDLRIYNSQKKANGKLFSFEFQDESGQIKITAFNEIADAFFNLIEEKKSYKISKGLIKMANKQYSINNSDYEINLDKSTNLEILEDEIAIKTEFTFVKINEISVCNNLDVIGVVKESYSASTITSKLTQKELLKKDVILVDETGSIKVTLFGNKAENQIETGDTLAIKSAKAGDYNGINISTNQASQIFINPLEERAFELKGWYENNKHNLPVKSQRNEVINLIQEVREQEIEYSTLIATIIFIKEENLWYDSCLTENCSKKVNLEENGKFRCEKCNLQFEECDARYVISAQVSDFSGQLWITLFNETGSSLFNVSAKELRSIKEENPDEIKSMVKSLYFKEKILKLKSRHECYNNEPKTKFNVLKVEDVDYLKETRRLLKELDKRMVI